MCFFVEMFCIRLGGAFVFNPEVNVLLTLASFHNDIHMLIGIMCLPLCLTTGKSYFSYFFYYFASALANIPDVTVHYDLRLPNIITKKNMLTDETVKYLVQNFI